MESSLGGQAPHLAQKPILLSIFWGDPLQSYPGSAPDGIYITVSVIHMHF